MEHSCIVADIGGTNARFAIANEGGVSSLQVFPCNAYGSFEEILDAFLQSIDGRKITHAAIAVATHVINDHVQLTNLPWSFSASDIARRYDFIEFKVLNDFAASAIAIPFLTESQLVKVCGGEELKAAKALIGAGTGLGMSGLLPCGDFWMPVEGEGGHVRLCPTTIFEKELFSIIQTGDQFVSAENVLSGRGLTSLHKAITLVEGLDVEEISPARVVELGMSGECVICEKVLDVFCGLLGSVAGDLAMILGAQGGVYIGGGIINHIHDYFVQSDNFIKHFEQKGPKTEYMKKIPVHIISDTKVGLLGAWMSMNPVYTDIGFTYKNNNLNNN